MKIVKPSVQLLAMSLPVHLDEKGTVVVDSLIPETLIERAGRVCYKSEDKITPDSYKGFVDHVVHQRHHESIVEHDSATILAVCDRGVSHEIVRHRIGSYSQESTRYCNYGKDKFGGEITVIEPPDLKASLVGWYEWKCSCERAEVAYLKMLADGVSAQIARSVLPTCLKTEIVITYNFREWKHFLSLRTSPVAHPQMRELALMMESELKKIAPTIFK